MNIVARLKNKEEISHLVNIGAHTIMLDTFDLTAKPIFVLDHQEFIEVYRLIKENGANVYVYLNKMIHESDLFKVEEWFNIFNQYPIDGIVINDFTLYVKSKSFALEDKIIYQPGTMNTNSFDAFFLQDKIKGMTLSKEITLDEILAIVKSSSKVEYSLVGHGYIDMFYSKRKLVTNYFIHKNKEMAKIINNHKFSLEEKTRDGIHYPILEDEIGTHIFRDKKLNSFQEMSLLKNHISDFFIERLFLEDDEYYLSIKAYLNDKDRIRFEEEYSENYNSGFYYLPTEKTKGDRHDD